MAAILNIHGATLYGTIEQIRDLLAGRVRDRAVIANFAGLNLVIVDQPLTPKDLPPGAQPVAPLLAGRKR